MAFLNNFSLISPTLVIVLLNIPTNKALEVYENDSVC